MRYLPLILLLAAGACSTESIRKTLFKTLKNEECQQYKTASECQSSYEEEYRILKEEERKKQDAKQLEQELIREKIPEEKPNNLLKDAE